MWKFNWDWRIHFKDGWLKWVVSWCWLSSRDISHYHVDLSSGLLVFTIQLMAFCKISGSWENRADATMAVLTLTQVTFLFLQYSISYTAHHIWSSLGLHCGVNSRRKESTGCAGSFLPQVGISRNQHCRSSPFIIEKKMLKNPSKQ